MSVGQDSYTHKKFSTHDDKMTNFVQVQTYQHEAIAEKEPTFCYLVWHIKNNVF